jgi:hypothetical protein
MTSPAGSTGPNPTPGDPSGASAPGNPVAGSGEQLLDAGSSGTDEGPAGIPAALVGHDRDGDEVAEPPAARPGTDEPDTGPAAEADQLSPSDTSAPQTTSASRGDTAG